MRFRGYEFIRSGASEIVMLDDVRRPLLEEARRSPSLLSDLAGLEQYVAESYDSRSFVELLQNADDACASRFLVQRHSNFLIVANDGQCFTRSDFKSLCRSAASTKTRGSSIGYRGIGFKSVVSFAQSFHLISGELATTFSRERTAKEVPEATRVPLVRIPHSLTSSDRSRFDLALNELLADGFTTAFVFEDLLAGGIENEFASFDPTSLLFLRHVRHVELCTDKRAIVTVQREPVDGRSRVIRLTGGESASEWLVVEREGIAIAFGRDGDRVRRLDERDAVVHAFLPTLEFTGLGVKIHGDISTDPSRTRVVFDDRTASGLDEVAGMIMMLLDGALSGDVADAAGIVAAIVPFSDPRMAVFQRRSFTTELVAAIQRSANSRFADLRLRPVWLNAIDFENLARAARIRAVPRNLEGVDGLRGLLQFLGAKEATFAELSPALSVAEASVPGAAELVTHLAQRHAIKQIDATQIGQDWRIWPVDGGVVSFAQAKTAATPLDREFADLVTEKSGMGAEVRRLVSALSDSPTADVLLPDSRATEKEQAVSPAPGGEPRVQHLSLKKWRSAEQQVFNLLSALGWTVEDVSRQNVGYDIEGKSPEGEEAFIEVKSIDYPGQSFTLTSNEEAIARQRGEKYRIAIVRQSDNFLEVAFIHDPVQHLSLKRQCRQWVWECATYTFTPQRFPLHDH